MAAGTITIMQCTQCKKYGDVYTISDNQKLCPECLDRQSDLSFSDMSDDIDTDSILGLVICAIVGLVVVCKAIDWIILPIIESFS